MICEIITEDKNEDKNHKTYFKKRRAKIIKQKC